MALPAITSYQLPSLGQVPENKVSWQLAPERAVLLVHDMQRYFVAAYQQGEEPMRTVIENIRNLIQRAHTLGVPVVYSAQPGDQDPEDRMLLSDFWGPGLRAIDEHESIIPELRPSETDHVLTKWRYSAFQRTDLRELLDDWGRDQLVVTGVYAHMGCLMTSVEAFMQDVQPFMIADAVADFSLADHEMALAYAARRCGVTISTEGVLSVLPHKSPERIAT